MKQANVDELRGLFDGLPEGEREAYERFLDALEIGDSEAAKKAMDDFGEAMIDWERDSDKRLEEVLWGNLPSTV